MRLKQQKRASSSWSRSLDSSTAYSELSLTLEFIVAPLRKILQSQDRSLEEKSIQLAVLAVRYQLSYADETHTASVEIFRTDTRFFESLVERSPRELAELITDLDLTNFRNLNLQNIIDTDETCRYLSREWNERSLAVHEGALVDQRFAKKALEVAKVGKYDPWCSLALLNMTNTASPCFEEFLFSSSFPSGPFRGGFQADHPSRHVPAPST